jgi:hypothetical protein
MTVTFEQGSKPRKIKNFLREKWKQASGLERRVLGQGKPFKVKT